jgi:hypothetical protein
VEILWTFFSHREQSLHQREVTMWMYPGQVVPTIPSPQSWVIRRSTPRSEGFLLMGSI